jgi:hypothetical protein
MDDKIRYRIKAAADGGFAVVVGPINGGMTTVSPFATEAAARAWIENAARLFGEAGPDEAPGSYTRR